MESLTLDQIAAEFPAYVIARVAEPRGWIADRQLSPTATLTVAARDLGALRDSLRAVEARR